MPSLAKDYVQVGKKEGPGIQTTNPLLTMQAPYQQVLVWQRHGACTVATKGHVYYQGHVLHTVGLGRIIPFLLNIEQLLLSLE